MATLGFEKLEVYRLAERLADTVWALVLKWDRLAKDTVGKQIIRSADSVGANIAEGTGRGTYVDNRRFVRMARASPYETHHWLRRAFTRKLIRSEDTKKITVIVDELRPRLNAYLRSIGPDPKTSNQSPGTKDK